ncbi:hypothetical protein [Leucobacter chromiireducens]|uniref:hypothetical protein n=1 Tax=Leucobacter chromiireducens TaxID=283877 RepID=UPI000F6364A8|nr:hypothetical protein [Leucobacter chromiireducens]
MTSPAFNIRALRLVGALRSYQVNFTDSDDADRIRDLSIIAGEISTGKTTVLEFIDWCLGAKEHPEHDEIVANVRSAQLAIDISQSEEAEAKQRRYVIERPLGMASTKAFLYEGDFDSMVAPPVRSFTYDPAESESLSHYLLQLCGLSGLRLDQAPTQVDSKTSVLSFRDLQPLWFLTNRRLDNGNLALEHHPHRSIKLNQVVNILFGVSDNDGSYLSRAVEELGAEERELGRAVQTLRAFMSDAGFTSIEELDEESDKLRVQSASLSARIRVIDDRVAARSDFTSELRGEYASAQREAQRVQLKLRDRETLASRLEPLRAQYADEIRRLDLVAESITLFDSLTVVTCPVCQSKLEDSPCVEDQRCSLCHTELTPGEASTPLDLSSEHRSLTLRLNQLLKFSQEVRSEAESLRNDLDEVRKRAARAQDSLDSASAEVISPYLAERDQIQRELVQVQASLKTLQKARQMLLQLRQRESELLQVSSALKDARARKANYLAEANPRDTMLAAVANRMHEILVDFEYPKIDLVRLEKNLVPHVRGKRYDKVGSSGAMTLIALAWELALFEIAFEKGSGHPGFLLVDSPQKNLVPGSVSTVGDAEVAELNASIATRRRHIVDNIYAHVERWLAAHTGAQIIFVDNQPPSNMDLHVVIRYSQHPDQPPYGLIDNEDGREASRELEAKVTELGPDSE